MQTQTFSTELLREIAISAIDKLKDGIGTGAEGCELHHELFNKDYYIIGRYQAERWLTDSIGVFEAISIIKEYNEMNFYEQDVDFSEAEIVANMLAYIVGESVLNESQTIQDKCDDTLTEADIKQIIIELENFINNL